MSKLINAMLVLGAGALALRYGPRLLEEAVGAAGRAHGSKIATLHRFYRENGFDIFDNGEFWDYAAQNLNEDLGEYWKVAAKQFGRNRELLRDHVKSIAAAANNDERLSEIRMFKTFYF